MVKFFSRKAAPAAALPGLEPGTPSGFVSLDQALGDGFRPGSMVVLAGPTGAGKSFLASQIALNAARWASDNDRGDVLFFSYEMSASELTARLIVQSSPDLRDGYAPPAGWSERDKPLARAALAKLEALRLRILDKASGEVSALREAVKRSVSRDGRKPSLVIVDHIGLVGAEGVEGDAATAARVSREIKAMAREFGVPVLVLAQMNRPLDSDGRPDYEPRLSDLNNSASVEQDASVVLLLHAPYLYWKDRDERRRAVAAGVPVTLIVAKNRSAMATDISLEWNGVKLTFRERGSAEANQESEDLRQEIDQEVAKLHREARKGRKGR